MKSLPAQLYSPQLLVQPPVIGEVPTAPAADNGSAQTSLESEETVHRMGGVVGRGDPEQVVTGAALLLSQLHGPPLIFSQGKTSSFKFMTRSSLRARVPYVNPRWLDYRNITA